MKVTETALPEVLVFEPRVFEDERGFFLETWNERVFADHGVHARFVQDNHSRSVRGVVRGLHYQVQQTQGKLLRVLSGAIFDVVVDLRCSSPRFGQVATIELSSDSHRMLWVPEGFAHGFMVTSDRADVAYKATDFYAPQFERTLLWNDPALGIRWPLDGPPLLSAKDMAGLPLAVTETL